MEDARCLAEGKACAIPDLIPEGFVPLRLVLEPIGLRVEVRKPEVIVGRHSQAEVRLALPEISRRHCRLAFENQQWHVYDLNSLNGVFVNGERMQEATLYDGDHLQLATFVFLVEHVVEAPLPMRNDLPPNMAGANKEQRLAS